MNQIGLTNTITPINFVNESGRTCEYNNSHHSVLLMNQTELVNTTFPSTLLMNQIGLTHTTIPICFVNESDRELVNTTFLSILLMNQTGLMNTDNSHQYC